MFKRMQEREREREREREIRQRKTNSVSASFQRSNSSPDKEHVLSSKKNLSVLQKIVRTCKRSKKASKQENGLQETLTRLQDERNCKLCTLEEAIIVFIPCGHLLVCKYCAASLTDCPICRVKINEFVKVYFS